MTREKIDFKKLIVENFITRIMLIMVLLLIVGIFLFVFSYGKTDSIGYVIAYEIGKAIIITILISIAINTFINTQSKKMENQRKMIEEDAREERELDRVKNEEEFKKAIQEQLKTLRNEVVSQTSDIAKKSSCFDAMQNANVDHIYTNREEASNDIKKAIVNDENEVVKITGISLNDFIRYENESLNQSWKYIQDKTYGEITNSR